MKINSKKLLGFKKGLMKELISIIMIVSLVISIMPNIQVNATAYNANIVVNGNGEEGLNGWTIDDPTNIWMVGTWDELAIEFDSSDSGKIFDYYPGSAGYSTASLYQIIDISSISSAIDSNSVGLNLNFEVKEWNDPSSGTLRIDCLDGGNSPIGTSYNFVSSNDGNENNLWQNKAETIASLPVGTRSIKVSMIAIVNSGSTGDYIEFDGIDVRLFPTDTVSPTVSSVTVPSSNTYISMQNLEFTVKYDESVIVNTAGGIPSIPLNLNSGVVNAAYVSGTGTTELVFRYTIQSPDLDTDGITLGDSIVLNGATINDSIGNIANLTLNSVGSTTDVRIDAKVPEVTSVGVPANGTYLEGQNLDFTVNFNENVSIIGTPFIPITLDSGIVVNATYLSGSGTSALTFRYTVQEGNVDTNGISIGAINLNSGTIKDIVTNNAILTLNSIGNTTSVLIDAVRPTISSVSVPANATYNTGNILQFTVNYSENVLVVGGTPTIAITLDSGDVVNASYVGGTGTSALVFQYTVQDGDLDTNGVIVGTEINLNGATIKDAASNNATLDLNSIGSTTLVHIDTVSPIVSSVSVPTNGTYITGQNMDFTVNFNENVTVSGTPYIALTLETGGVVNASYIGGTGANALVFRYTVQAGNLDADGVAVGTEINLNGATIKDIGSNDALLTLNSIGDLTTVLIDGVLPTISSVGVPTNGTYISGDNISFTLNFNEAVIVNIGGGTPYIPITFDSGIVNVPYVSGSGSNILVFRYTIQANNYDPNGIEVGSQIILNGGTIRDSAPNNTVLTLNSVGSTTDILIDAKVPEVTSVGVPVNGKYCEGDNLDFTVTFNENVIITGTPFIPITLDNEVVVNATYLSGSGTSTLTFGYTVQEGNVDTNGISIGAINLNDGTIKDIVTNNATLTLNSIGNTTSVLIDAVRPTVSSVSVPVNAIYNTGNIQEFTVNCSEDVLVVGGIPSIAITLDSGVIVNALYVGGTGTKALVFQYTVQDGDLDTDGVIVGTEINLNGATIKDAATNNATLNLNNIGDTTLVQIDTVSPIVSSASVPANGSYIVGQNMDFTVNFNENVTVSGTPYIALTLETGGVVNASYIGGTGTSALVFRYTVQAGNLDADGVTVGTEINLNGATIKDIGTNDAILTLNGIGNPTAVLIDGVLPTISSVDVPPHGTYISGNNISFTLNFNEAVIVDTSGGTPYIPVTFASGIVNASYVNGSGSNILVFQYTIEANNYDPNGIEVGSQIVLNGGTIKDNASNNTVLTLNNTGNTIGILIDTKAPEVISVEVPANGTYKIGEYLDFTINYNENVLIIGTPFIPITLDNGVVVNAFYLTGTGTSAPTFRYTVKEGNVDTNGISIEAINLNGGTIIDLVSNNAILTLNSIGNTTGVLVDAARPMVSSVSVPTNLIYNIGYIMEFTVKYNENVLVVGGIPSIAITLDSGDIVNALYVGGTGTKALVFRYTVQDGDLDTDGVIVGTEINLNGTTIKDAATNNAILILNNIGDTTLVQIDTVSPIVSSVSVPANGSYIAGQNMDFTVNFNENLIVSGTPYITLTLETGGVVNASYIGGTGTSALVFRYTIQEGNLDTDGVAVGSEINLNGAMLKDIGTNDAILTLNGIGDLTTVLVDAVAPNVSSVGVPANRSYMSEQNLDFIIKYSETVIVNTSGGTPSIALTLNTGGLVNATYVSGSGTNELKFRYIIQVGNMDSNGIEIGQNIDLNGGTIKDSGANNATLTLNNIGITNSVLIDTVAPTLAITSAASSLSNVSPVSVTFTFDEDVTDFSISDITVGNGIAENFKIVNAYTYTAEITPSGQGNFTVDIAEGVAQDLAGNNNNVATQLRRIYDSVAPNVSNLATNTLAQNNGYIDIIFDEGVYGASDGTTALTPAKFVLIFTQNTGTATNVSISSIKKANNEDEGAALALTGGENVVRIFLTISGIPNGTETIEIKPADASSIYDQAGNASSPTLTTGIKTLNDKVLPMVSSVTPTDDSVEVDKNTNLVITFNEKVVKGTGDITIRKTSDNSVFEVIDVTSGQVTGSGTTVITVNPTNELNGSTEYYIQIAVSAFKDTAGNSYSGIMDKTRWSFTTTSLSTNTNTTEEQKYTNVLVNGKEVNAGNREETEDENGRTTTTLLVDAKIIQDRLEEEGVGAVVTIPVASESDVIVGQLNGQTVKDMENVEAILEVRTENVTYTIPASQIKIDKISEDLGVGVELKDIQVKVTIANPSKDTVEIIEKTANTNNYRIVVKPIEFEITCTYDNQTVTVSKFNGYVERLVAIPDGIDSSKITTGIVLNEDGTFSHVPTTIIVVDGKHYAKINSLTNSTYSVIYSPKEFADLEGHWAQEDINDMGSRLIVSGINNDIYDPNKDITRAEFAAIIVRALGLMRSNVGETVFQDVYQTDWYYEAVSIAYEYGIIEGVGGNNFNPNNKITRQEAMVMISRAMKVIKKIDMTLASQEITTLLGEYTDSDKLDSWAKQSAAICIDKDIITGYNKLLSGKENITRAETAAIVRRLLKKANLI